MPGRWAGMHRVAALVLLVACHAAPRRTARPPARDVDGDGLADAVLDRRQLLLGLDRTRAVDVRAPDGTVPPHGALALIGDVDGDGFADVLLGDPRCGDDGECGIGRAFLFRGEPGGLARSPTQVIHGGEANQLFGERIVALGDLDGDGLDDVALPAIGGSYVFLGTPDGLADTPIELAVRSIAAAGDVDGDGLADAVGLDPEALTLYRGGPGGVSNARSIPVAMPDHVNVRGGYRTAAGDFDGDGFADLAVVVDDVGIAIHVHGGGAAGYSVEPVTVIRHRAFSDHGVDPMSAGDVDGDGDDDLAVAVACVVRSPPFGYCEENRAFLYLGTPDGLVEHPSDILSQAERWSSGLNGLGDVDGDGTDELGYGGYVYRYGHELRRDPL